MKAAEELQSYRDTTPEELGQKVRGLEEELMKLRFRLAAGQLDNSAQLKTVRKNIARIKTVLNEKRESDERDAN